MFVSAYKITFMIPHSFSLKDKRSVIKSISEKTKAKFGVSVAEVADHDMLNKAVLGFACVSGSMGHAEEMAQKITAYIELFDTAEIIDIESDSIAL